VFEIGQLRLLEAFAPIKVAMFFTSIGVDVQPYRQHQDWVEAFTEPREPENKNSLSLKLMRVNLNLETRVYGQSRPSSTLRLSFRPGERSLQGAVHAQI
jgi:hypothetical protein